MAFPHPEPRAAYERDRALRLRTPPHDPPRMTAETFLSPTFILGLVLGLIGLCAIAVAIAQHTVRASTGVEQPQPHRSSPATLITLAILVLLAAWYWYSFRPSQIRAYCAKKYPPSAPTALRAVFPEDYDRCLAERGLAQ